MIPLYPNHARALAVLNRVKPQSTIERTQAVYEAFAGEWRPVAPRGTAAVLAEMLLMDSIGYVCFECGAAFFGPPARIESSSKSDIVRTRCRGCADQPPEPRAWPFGRGRKQ